MMDLEIGSKLFYEIFIHKRKMKTIAEYYHDKLYF